MTQESLPTANAFLDRLPPTSLARLLPLLERVGVERDQVLDDSARAMRYADFPITALLSLIEHSEHGATLELAMIGAEGMKGLPILESAIWTSAFAAQVVVQESGEVLRLKAPSFQSAVAQDRELHRAVLMYYARRYAEVTQIAFCNQFCPIDQQLSRWLLRRLSHTGKPEFDITHERIAGLLGVRREAVSHAAGKLQRAGILSYRHGHVKVLNRPGLEASACRCHEKIESFHRTIDDAVLNNRQLALPRAGTASQTVASRGSRTSRSVPTELVPRS